MKKPWFYFEPRNKKLLLEWIEEARKKKGFRLVLYFGRIDILNAFLKGLDLDDFTGETIDQVQRNLGIPVHTSVFLEYDHIRLIYNETIFPWNDEVRVHVHSLYQEEN